MVASNENRREHGALAVVALFVVLAAGSPSCSESESACTLDDCRGNECTLVSGRRLDCGATTENVEPIACLAGGLGGDTEETYARDPDGCCWWFPSTLLPPTFVEDDSCSPY
jgi:hypothetical protein